ncbi:MAG: hypothetical protein WC528_04005 [Patescibacteria group bacterium]
MFSLGKRLLSALEFCFGAFLLFLIFTVGSFIFCFSNLKMIVGGILIIAYFLTLLPLTALIIGLSLWALVIFTLILGQPVIMDDGAWILN